MNRKKIVLRLGLAAVILLILAGGARLYEHLYDHSIEKRLMVERGKQTAKLSEYYQKYLDQTAGKITDLTVDPLLISQIKSEIFKSSPGTALYLWMSDEREKFILGVPSPVFTRMNNLFDKYQALIEKDGSYVDRNDFLLRKVGRQNRPRQPFTEINFQKNFLRYDSYPSRSIVLTLSSPIINKEGRMIGDLYLKVIDSSLYGSFDRPENFLNVLFFPASRILLGFLLVFLWFLLPSWVYLDARQRDVKHAGKWALLTLISFGFAAIVYSIVRPAALKSFHCPECRKELNGTRAFCPYCGFDLSSTFCPQCQYPLKPDWLFCPNCRWDLKQKPQQAEEES
jgi:hypothetical protein